MRGSGSAPNSSRPSNRSSSLAGRTGSCRSGSSRLASTGAQLVEPHSIGVDGVGARNSSAVVRENRRLALTPKQALKNSQATSYLSPHFKDPFELTFTSLNGEAITVQAIRTNTCKEVQERVALEMGIPSYRVTISTETGVVLNGQKTLQQCGILDSVGLLVVIGEADRWRDMCQDQFIELVVANELDTRENVVRSLRADRANEMKVRRRYIPRIEKIEKAEERKRLRLHMQNLVVSEANAMVSELGVTGATSKMQAKISDFEAICNGKASEISSIKLNAQEDLDIILPVLEAAVAALSRICKRDIVELKAFKVPAELVKLTGEALCILFHERPTWDNAKMLFMDINLLNKMLNYDKDDICPATIKQLDAYIQNPDFTPERVGQASIAAAGMCHWVRAMHQYHAIAKTVEPKKQKLMECEEDLNDAIFEIELWRKQLAAVAA